MRLQRHLLAASVLAALFLAGCGDKSKGATQAAARVNDGEITVHQINQALQQQRGIKPEQVDAVSRQLLDRLIDQELAVQKANEQKLDRQPAVVANLEAAKREILARAYAESVGDTVVKPTADEVQKYFNDKPALFAQRRVFTLQEFNVSTPFSEAPNLQAKIQNARNGSDLANVLNAMGLRFEVSQSTQPAEALPLNVLDQLAALSVGQSLVLPQPGGLKVVLVAGAQSAPVTLEQARPAIEQYLLNERRRQAIEAAMKGLRQSAKIEYQGRFAQAASAPQAAQPAASAASSGLDDATVKKGLGLK